MLGNVMMVRMKVTGEFVWSKGCKLRRHRPALPNGKAVLVCLVVSIGQRMNGGGLKSDLVDETERNIQVASFYYFFLSLFVLFLFSSSS